MGLKDRTYLCFTVCILLSVFVISAGQNFLSSNDAQDEGDRRIPIRWCTVSRAEYRKCNSFSMANERDRLNVGYDHFRIECLQAVDKDECMSLLDQEKATLTTLDAGEVFVGGRYHSLVPIAREMLSSGAGNYFAVAAIKKGTLSDVQSLYDLRGRKACFAGVQSFAGWILPIYILMKQGGLEIADCNNHVKSATKYFGPSCAVDSLSDKYNPIGDNSDKLCQLCIGRQPGGRCTSEDPYAGFKGAFMCLLEAGEIAFLKHSTIPELVSGDEFSALSKDSFELLCMDGSRKSVDDYLSCNWGQVPSDAVVTTSASSFELRRKYQLFLEKAAERYGGGGLNRTRFQEDSREYNRDNSYDRYNTRNNQAEFDQFGNRLQRLKRQNYGDYRSPNRDQDERRYDDRRPPERNFDRDPQTINRDQFGVNIDPYPDGSYNNRNRDFQYNQSYPREPFYYDRNNGSFYEQFDLFESSPRFGIHGNLLFQDATRSFQALEESQQTFAGYLGRGLDVVMGVRDCPVLKMTLCVTSDVEKDKCVKMRTAMNAQLLKPEMECYKAHSQINCMQAIKSGIADVAVLDASDVYTAGLNFDLIPFISEVYNLNEPEYYVVAVAKESDPSTELTYLRGKYTCHAGINTAAGWVYPLAFLISNGWIRPYGCNSIRAAAEYFSKSCVPGALSIEYNTGVPYENMCDLCHGASFRHCRRDASEDYYGHTGAFRCLVEGGGQVAFVKHTTVTENTGGKREEWWARDNLNDDFELLCPDGTRAEINDYPRCNLGKVKANAIVTRGGYGFNETHVNAFINLFLYAQTFYGRKTTDEFSFSMFSSNPPYTDLIFQDATTQLKVIHPSDRFFVNYLGSDFMRARRIVDCHAGSHSLGASIVLMLIPAIFVFIFRL